MLALYKSYYHEDHTQISGHSKLDFKVFLRGLTEYGVTEYLKLIKFYYPLWSEEYY